MAGIEASLHHHAHSSDCLIDRDSSAFYGAAVPLQRACSRGLSLDLGASQEIPNRVADSSPISQRERSKDANEIALSIIVSSSCDRMLNCEKQGLPQYFLSAVNRRMRVARPDFADDLESELEFPY